VRQLIINADGYGFTAGITSAIEECIEFGTVRSLSANVNFRGAGRLADLVRRHPDLSVGCHLNPVVGKPLLPPERVRTLLGPDRDFHYKSFARKLSGGAIDLAELRAELMAQIARTKELVGAAFTHVDFHMGLHRLPRLYPLFLEVAQASGTGRIRTHRYRVGLEGRRPSLHHWTYILRSPVRAAKYAWNLILRARAQRAGLSMPDSWVSVTEMATHPDRISVANYVNLLHNVPTGIHEFVVHPAYLDDELRRYSTYLEPRERERRVLLSPDFKEALQGSGVRLAGYRDIPRSGSGEAAARPGALL
jgi:predicted glycoside hydrolase/deacetylase ChbG (UPF0249 family)